MPPRYFFHAPDDRVYGPIDFATLQRWRADGRLRDDSRLRSERDGSLLTYAELAAAPPAPETEAAPPPVLPPVPTAPPVAEAPAATLGQLIGRGFALYWRGFGTLWLTAVALQLPFAAFNLALPFTSDPKTGFLVLAPQAHRLWICLGLLFLFLFSEVGCAFLTLLARQLAEGLPLSLGAAWHGVRSRLGALLKTWLVRWLIVGSLLFIAAFCFLLAHGAGASAPTKLILLGVALLFGVPALVLFVRYLVVPQVVMLEPKSGLQALRRAGDLIRFGGGPNPFSSGDLRLLALALLPWLLAAFAGNLLLAADPTAAKSAAILPIVVSAFGAATATPLMVLFFVLFVRDAATRVREGAPKDADAS